VAFIWEAQLLTTAGECRITGRPLPRPQAREGGEQAARLKVCHQPRSRLSRLSLAATPLTVAHIERGPRLEFSSMMDTRYLAFAGAARSDVRGCSALPADLCLE